MYIRFPIAFPGSTWNYISQESRSALGSWLVPDPISPGGSWWLFHSLKFLWPLSQKIIYPAFDEKIEVIQYFFIFPFCSPLFPHTTPKHLIYLSNHASLHLFEMDKARLWSSKALGLNLRLLYLPAGWPSICYFPTLSLLFFIHKMGI